MTKWHLPVMAATLAGAVTFGGDMVAPAWSASPGVLKSLDPDNDGTIDRNEAKAAAERVFDRLDRDKDGTLDKRELFGRLSAKDLAAADADKDGTLDKREYTGVVERRFKAADPDNDGTLDARELRSRAGRALLRLVK
jgi:Ca2+-binding EF-hand superfamily protein